jgi:hypothetical protein
VVAREFRVHAGCEKAFERVFGSEGDWAGLLRRCSPGYLATELKMVAAEGRRYEVRDCWKSHRSFELFREVYQVEVEWFREWLKEKDLVEQEIFLGAFYSGEDQDRGDEAGGVPA